MSRRRRKELKRSRTPDAKYKSELLSSLINVVMKDGKKSLAEYIVYGALDVAASRLKEDPAEIFDVALNNVRPQVEVRSRRIGGATYQVPVMVKDSRSISLALRWIRQAAATSRRRSSKSYMTCLANELVEAYNKRGGAYKIREEKYKMAEANKAFSHFKTN